MPDLSADDCALLSYTAWRAYQKWLVDTIMRQFGVSPAELARPLNLNRAEALTQEHLFTRRLAGEKAAPDDR